MKDFNLLEFTKLYISADQETKNMIMFCLKNPDKIAKILEKIGGVVLLQQRIYGRNCGRLWSNYLGCRQIGDTLFFWPCMAFNLFNGSLYGFCLFRAIWGKMERVRLPGLSFRGCCYSLLSSRECAGCVRLWLCGGV